MYAYLNTTHKLISRVVERKAGKFLYQLVNKQTSAVITTRLSNECFIAVCINGNSYRYFKSIDDVNKDSANNTDRKYAYIEY